ncbi:hypothetical protein R3I93_004676 [Phoxinus phoxinus]|uniref:Uncharacterized protein n=1 Tax=Phoxinus phoxinus TaxID=58324 RepID=A0AAN9HE39_9TELE
MRGEMGRQESGWSSGVLLERKSSK